MPFSSPAQPLMTCRPEQVQNGTSSIAATMQRRRMPLAIILLITATGCQSTKGQYDVRMWADVNSLGSPAAFIDQSRHTGFRPEPPANTPDIPETVCFETGSSDIEGQMYQTIPVFPATSPASESDFHPQGTGTGTTHSSISEHGSAIKAMSHTDGYARNRQLPTKQRQAVVPPGAWLF